MPFWMCLSQGPGSSTSRNDWHVTLLVPKFVEDQSCPEVTVTEELLAVARRWCQMWGSAHVLAVERPIPWRPQLVLRCPSPGSRSPPDVELASREFHPSAIVLLQLKRSVLAGLPVIIS